MGALLTPAVRSHLWRLVRLPAFTVAAAAVVSPLIHSATARWPAVGVVLALLEIFTRTVKPTEPASPPVIAGQRTTPPPA